MRNLLCDVQTCPPLGKTRAMMKEASKQGATHCHQHRENKLTAKNSEKFVRCRTSPLPSRHLDRVTLAHATCPSQRPTTRNVAAVRQAPSVRPCPRLSTKMSDKITTEHAHNKSLDTDATASVLERHSRLRGTLGAQWTGAVGTAAPSCFTTQLNAP
jgi:hypothetical protein